MSAQGAQTIQFVWFTNAAEKVEAEPLFKRVWGFDPDMTNRNRTPSPLNPYLQNCTGDKDGWLAVTQTQPGRIDIVLTLNEANGAQPWRSEFLRPSDTVRHIHDTILSSEFNIPEVTRQALVLRLVGRVENYRQAANNIYQNTGFDPGFDDVSDLEVKINRREFFPSRPSRQMNRLMHFFVTSANAILLGGEGSVLNFPEQLRSNVEIDINSVPLVTPYDKAEQDAVWSDIVNEALLLAERPEIRYLNKGAI